MSSDDEAPEEVGQAAAREEYVAATAAEAKAKAAVDAEARRKALSRARKRAKLAETLSADLLKEAAEAQREKREAERREKRREKRRRELEERGALVVGGARPSKRASLGVLPEREDNIQLAAPAKINGKEVIVYQSAPRSTLFDEDEDVAPGVANMDKSVRRFAANFFQGKRRDRASLKSMQRPQRGGRRGRA